MHIEVCTDFLISLLGRAGVAHKPFSNIPEITFLRERRKGELVSFKHGLFLSNFCIFWCHRKLN